MVEKDKPKVKVISEPLREPEQSTSGVSAKGSIN